MSAMCTSCDTALSGNWSMESNSSNAKYLICPNGRYLGISDGYFFHNKPDWVYCYCKECWIIQIKSLNINCNNTDMTTIDSLKEAF